MKIRDGSFFQKELPVIIYNVYLERSTIVSHISRIDNGFLHQVALRKFLRIDVAVDMFTSMHRCHCGYVSMIESDVWCIYPYIPVSNHLTVTAILYVYNIYIYIQLVLLPMSP